MKEREKADEQEDKNEMSPLRCNFNSGERSKFSFAVPEPTLGSKLL